MLDAGATGVWEDVKLALKAACDAYNARYCEKTRPEVTYTHNTEMTLLSLGELLSPSSIKKSTLRRLSNLIQTHRR